MPNIRQATFLITAIALLSITAIAQQARPRAAVQSFYRFDGSNSQVFNRKNIDARRGWFENSLYELLIKELDREREFLKANKGDKPHFGDGLPFRPLQESCKAAGQTYGYTSAVGEANEVGETATVPVTFSYPKDCNLPPTVYNVKLIAVKTTWLIVDVEYPSGESLVADLKRAIY